MSARSGASGADQSARHQQNRPRLPRQAKLPNNTSSDTPSLSLSPPTTPYPLRSSRRLSGIGGPVQLISPGRRKASNSNYHDASIPTKRPRRSLRGSTARVSYVEPDSDSDSDLVSDSDDGNGDGDDDAAHDDLDTDMGMNEYDDDDHDDGNDGDGDSDDVDDDDYRGDDRSIKNISSPCKGLRSRREVSKPRKLAKPSSRFLSSKSKKSKQKQKGKQKQGQEQMDMSHDDENKLTYPGNTLPYLVWHRIFEYVGYPLVEPDARKADIVVATRKLLSVALLGKLLYEPAMAALYKSPPMFDQIRFRLLSRTLRASPDTTTINYRPKVEVLEIEISDILSYKLDHNYSLLDDVVPFLPRLKTLDLYHVLDEPPYRQLEASIRYKYPSNLLRTLELKPDTSGNPGSIASPIELQSWRWNSRITGPDFALHKLAAIHQQPSFASLRKVAFVNYQLPSYTNFRHPENADESTVANLAAAIQALPRLEHLIFESSTVADYYLLSLLPTGLKHLELINCWEVTSDKLAGFLRTHGHSLERLTLKHCISLSLGFLRILDTACPNLTDLHVNLLYYKAHEHYNDADPLYEWLLGDDEVPHWPASLQSIEIDYMKFDNVPTAEMFFKSLVASAPALPNLRRLVIGAKLNVSYRERSEFRKTLLARMSDVFQRRSKPPTSIRAQQLAERSEQGQHQIRRRTRRAVQSVSRTTSDGDDSSVSPKKYLAKELQWSMRDRPTRSREDSDDEELTAHHRGLLKLDDDDDFVHGLCDLVRIELDNQKPTEHKYSMDDFLDATEGEDSDADWDENYG